MSNKTQLQQNNTKLQAHLQDILGLPTAAEIAAGASTGQYVWKKYEWIPDNPRNDLSFTGTIPAVSSATEYMTISNENFDLGLIEDFKSFFDGFSANGSYPKFVIGTNGSLQLWADASGAAASVSVINSFSLDNKKLIFDNTATTYTDKVYDFSSNDVKLTEPAHTGELIGYVVSDYPTAYPNDGVQDGFWYERIDKLQKGLNILERREDGSASKICLNYDGETLDKDNGLGEGAGSYAICAAEEVTIIADTLRNSGSSFSIAFYIGFRERCKKAKLKIKDTLDVGGSSVTIQYAKKLWVSNMTSITVGSGTYRYGLGSSKTETIYAEPNSKPSGWDSRWNYYGTSSYNTVVWGVSEEQFDAM